MATPTTPPCWPNDPDWLDGKDEVNVPNGVLRAYWDTDIVDANGVPPGTIIGSDDLFKVRFRVELVGDLWRCICGSWCFDVGFSPIGSGSGFYLSEVLKDPSVLEITGWEGCQTCCIELCVDVPPGTIPAGKCGTVYEVAAKYELHCCDGHVALVGYEALEEYEFYFRHTP
jgi:hypothetical protein